jgi:hypothetical protein
MVHIEHIDQDILIALIWWQGTSAFSPSAHS